MRITAWRSPRVSGSPDAPALLRPAWEWWQQQGVLTALVVLTLVLTCYRLDQEGEGNLYYAAGVQSMLANWHNFFFVAFDPAGFVTLDKPPLGFWLQAASARLLGFSGVSLFLPEALAGIVAVGLLYAMVRRAFGPLAGALAGLFLALTPISVATSRNNTIDSLLVLTVLAAAWATLRATETGRVRWLLVAGVVVGIGFNIKMLEAFLVLPALYLVYLVAAPGHWPVRALHIAGATVALFAVALCWAVAVDLTPAADRPWVGSSTRNSVLDLIVWHNGLSRVLPGQTLFDGPAPPPVEGPAAPAFGSARRPDPQVFENAQPQGAIARPFGGFGVGPPGPLRLLTGQLGSQIGWFLPLALFSLALVAWVQRREARHQLAQQGFWLWGGWCLTVGLFFSFTRQFQPYYLVMLAPAIAALGGAGVATAWRAYRAGGWQGWLLPVLVAGGAAWEVCLLGGFPEWEERLAPWILGLSVGSIVVLVGVRCLPCLCEQRAWSPRAAVALSALALVLAPTVWASAPIWAGMGPRPLASPQSTGGRLRTGASPAEGATDYLLTHRGDAQFLAATLSANAAAPLILGTGQPVMAVGGFSGRDPILSADEFAARVADGVVRFALFPTPRESVDPDVEDGTGQSQAVVEWVQAHCATVPAADWRSGLEADRADPSAPPANGGAARGAGARRGGGAGPGGALALFDCGMVPGIAGS